MQKVNHFKHSTHGHVITHGSLIRLPNRVRPFYSHTTEEPTHHVTKDIDEEEDNSNITSSLLSLGTGIAIAESIFDSSPSYDVASVDNTPDVEMGGGDFGGGGSSSDF